MPHRPALVLSIVFMMLISGPVLAQGPAVQPKDAVIRELSIISSELDRYEFVRGAGCENCNESGHLGRTGVFEMLVPNSAIRRTHPVRARKHEQRTTRRRQREKTD